MAEGDLALSADCRYVVFAYRYPVNMRLGNDRRDLCGGEFFVAFANNDPLLSGSSRRVAMRELTIEYQHCVAVSESLEVIDVLLNC